jgi:hypothetical protein
MQCLVERKIDRKHGILVLDCYYRKASKEKQNLE